jgi:hypothetical protein
MRGCLRYWQSHSGRKSAIILAATLPLVLCYAAGASSNLHRHGHFRIGSYAGMSLLGRGVVLAQPLSENSSFKSADWIVEAVLPVRNALAQIQHPILKALVVRQYYDNLRWFVLLDQFEERLPGWREASHYEQGRLAGFLASAYIRNDFCGYSELFALDYLSLWVVPRILTTNEHEFLERTYRTLDPLPFLAEFEKTDLGAIHYYKVVPPAKLRSPAVPNFRYEPK